MPLNGWTGRKPRKRKSKAMRKQSKKGRVLPVLIILVFVFILSLTGLKPLAVIVLILGALGNCIDLAFGKTAGKNGKKNNPVPFRPVSPGTGKACPNPETHRHYETRKPCPNQEPHRHYSSGVSQPLTQIQQDEAARKKRLENMRVLYDAGLLTREEYDYEVRRLKNL